MGPKWRNNLVRQTIYPVAPSLASRAQGTVIWAPRGFSSPTPMTLPFVAHIASLLGRLHSLFVTFLHRWFTLMASPTYCGLHYIFGFTITASHVTLSWTPCRESKSVTHWLTSQAFLWNMGGSLYDLITLGCCMFAKPNITRTMWRSANSLNST
jgi:hypothetical protein